MASRFTLWFAVLGCVLFFLGCSKEQEKPSAKKSIPPAKVEVTGKMSGYQSIAVQDGGTINGKVIFKGSWKPSNIPVTKDQEVCGKNKQDPSLIVNERGEVQVAVVRLVGIQKGKAIKEVKPVLDQEGCAYKPHVLAMPVGTTLEILNSDGLLHNVHSFSKKNKPFNMAQPKYRKKITQTFKEAELISIKCDVHGWMSAWLIVVDHPYYDVTSASGNFSLAEVPPGDYMLEAWHEKLGKQSQRVKVEPNQKVEVTFKYPTKK